MLILTNNIENLKTTFFHNYNNTTWHVWIKISNSIPQGFHQLLYDFDVLSVDDDSLCVDVTVESVAALDEVDETTFDDVTWLLLVNTWTPPPLLFFFAASAVVFDKSWASSTCVATRFFGVWMIWNIGRDDIAGDEAEDDCEAEKSRDEVERVVTNFGVEVNMVLVTAAPDDLKFSFCGPIVLLLLVDEALMPVVKQLFEAFARKNCWLMCCCCSISESLRFRFSAWWRRLVCCPSLSESLVSVSDVILELP